MNSSYINSFPFEIGSSDKVPTDAISAVSFSVEGKGQLAWLNHEVKNVDGKHQSNNVSKATIKNRMGIFLGEFLNNIENAPKIYRVTIVLSVVILFISFTIIAIASAMVAGANFGRASKVDNVVDDNLIPSSPLTEFQGLSPTNSPTFRFNSGQNFIVTSPPSLSSSYSPSFNPTISPSSSPFSIPSLSPNTLNSSSPTVARTSLPSQYPSHVIIQPTLPPTTVTTSINKEEGIGLMFYVMGDSPLNEDDAIIMEQQIYELPDDGTFLMHVGGINNAEQDGCMSQSFQRTKNILENSPLPVFIVPGENDWNKCPNPGNAMDTWLSLFQNFESKWNHGLQVERSSMKPIFFAFVQSKVLVLGIHFIGPPIINDEEWKELVLDNVLWVVRKVQRYKDEIESIAVLGHANPNPDVHSAFTDSISKACKSWQIPMLYVHSGDTGYYEKRGAEVTNFDCEFMTDVQINIGRDAPPLRISVKNNSNNPFILDRRLST